MAFDHIRYARNVSDLSTVTVEMSEMPDKYVVVENVMYFADSSGYVMMHPVSGDWSDVSGSTDSSPMPEEFGMPDSSHDGRKMAVNAKWYDEGEYGPLAPEEVTHAIRVVVIALSVLHGFGVFNYEIR